MVRGTEENFNTGNFDFFVSGLDAGLSVEAGEGGVILLCGDPILRGGVVTVGRTADVVVSSVVAVAVSIEGGSGGIKEPILSSVSVS